jgi:hypothetical protein
VAAVERADLPDFSGGDEVARKPEERVLEVVEPDGGRDPGPFCGESHLERLGHGRRERLLAIDVLAGGDGGKRHLLVHDVRRRDGDDVDRRVGDQLAPVAGRTLEPEPFSGTRGMIRVDIGKQRELELDREREHASGIREAVRVGLPHEPRADQTNPKTHARSPFRQRWQPAGLSGSRTLPQSIYVAYRFRSNQLTMAGIFCSKPPGMKKFKSPIPASVRFSKSCVTPAGMRMKEPLPSSTHWSPIRMLAVPSRT